MWSDRLRRPAIFGLVIMLSYFAATVPMLIRGGFDPSIFIVAGDRFVTSAETASPIHVHPHSDGYDGQFYYRLAMAPLSTAPVIYGVTFDHPSWRMQRILLPLLARAVALGHPGAVPAALFAVNLAGLFAIAWLTIPIAMVAWPGFFVALTHDTTEIVGAALILGTIAAWLARRTGIVSILLICATLTRETAILVAAGLLIASLLRAMRLPRSGRQWRESACIAASMLPFFIWRNVVTTLWHDPPQAHGVDHNVGLPLLGLAQIVLANISGHAVGRARDPGNHLARFTALWSVSILVCFCLATFRTTLAIIARNGLAVGPAVGWLLTLCLMCLLTANGPWIEPAAWFRAFTECWLLGWILLGLARVHLPPPAWLAAAALPLLLRNFELCWIQLR
jgi:hypothetical protein